MFNDIPYATGVTITAPGRKPLVVSENIMTRGTRVHPPHTEPASHIVLEPAMPEVSDIPMPEVIEQEIVPSQGTKLVCTACGREDFHTLILRRRRGLLEGLCKQQDGSGCYPNASRNNCRFVDSDRLNCQQLAEWEIMDRVTAKTISEVCTDHVGLMLSQTGGDIYPMVD